MFAPSFEVRISRAKAGKAKSAERGVVVLLFALLMTAILLPGMALGIDYSFVYLAKIRLVAAVDAAALAGCRSLSIGQDFASQKANAQNVALQYFAANFPTGYLGASGITPTADAEQSSTLYRTVVVTAQASIPMHILSVFGYPSMNVQASAKTSRRNVAIMLALDRSGSMIPVCGTLRSDATSFVNGFADNLDTMGLVTFMGTANVDWGLSSVFKSSITSAIGNLRCGNGTGTAEALTYSISQLQAAPSGTMRVIVLFTDGVPDGYSGRFLGIGKCGSSNPTGVPGILFTEAGLGYRIQQSISDTNLYFSSPSNCDGWTDDATLAQNDYPVIPETDLSNTLPNCTGCVANSASLSTYLPLQRNSLGQIVMSSTNATAAATNAADYAAYLARTQGIRVYTIGLGSNGGVDGAWLMRIANDPSSADYNALQPTGKYAFAADAAQLANAFNSIKSEILRISQ